VRLLLIQEAGGGGAGVYGAGNGGAGGSGIVILRVPTAKYNRVQIQYTGSPTVTTDVIDSDTVIQFTVDGSYTA
jgi:hypothetical protein